MEILKREDMAVMMQPGRKCCTPVRPTPHDNENQLMAAFAYFSYDYGKMDTHFHQNEYMYVIDCKDAVVTHGMNLENMVTEPLKAGEIYRPIDGEWHRFDFTCEDGYVDFLNFFADFPPRTVNAADYKK